MTFTPLASSSAGCSYRVDAPGAATLLIDCGIRYETLQQGLNFQVTQLAGCLVSHGHGDHCKSALRLMKAGVNCYGSLETWGKVPHLGHRANIMGPQEQWTVGDWAVKPFECVHDEPGTLGFLVGAPQGGVLVYLTDSAYSKYKFDGVTHWAVEANYSSELIKAGTASGRIGAQRFNRTVRTHMSIDRLEQMLDANDLSTAEEIWLLHLSSENSNEEEFKARIQRRYGIPVYVAAEGRV
jgi:phosphoribosyl 1,2-cyclic phosphodiesterase